MNSKMIGFVSFALITFLFLFALYYLNMQTVNKDRKLVSSEYLFR